LISDGFGARYSLLVVHSQIKTDTEASAAANKIAYPWVLPLWIIAVFVMIVFLRMARSALVPFALSLLFALILSGGVEFLRRHRIPRALSAAILLVIFGVAIGGLFELVWSPAQQWLADAPRTLQAIERKVRPAQAFFRRFEDTANRATSLGGPVHTAAPSPAAAAAMPVTAAAVLTETGSMVTVAATILVFTLFLLAAGPPTLARMTAALAGDRPAVHILKVIDAIRHEVGRYYGTLVLINLGLGTITAVVMGLLGMPNPILWGVMAGLLNFIPYLGSTTTLVILTVVALVTFDSVSKVLLVSASYLALAAIEGQVIQPIFVGRRLDLNPIIVFLAVWIGGVLWGMPGIVLAVPVLVATKVAASHSAGGAVVVAFLSPSAPGALTPLGKTVARARDAVGGRRPAP
jgi:predicted PurR-regulated permease PerM